MKILLLGKTGQVGKSIIKASDKRNQIISFDKFEMPLDNIKKLEKNLSSVLKKNDFDILINAAAFTNVERSEEETKLAKTINSDSLAVITNELYKTKDKKNTLLIHFSTDYVFDGSGITPWKPENKTNPINAYGESKVGGELNIFSSYIPYILLRTSWVFSETNNNFLLKILDKIKKREKINIVDDQVGSPTSSDFIANFCFHVINDKNLLKKTGVYHLTGKGYISWYGFAKYILDIAEREKITSKKITNKIIFPVKSDKFFTKALRPKNSRLDCSKLEKTFDFNRSTWQEQTEDTIKQIIKKER